MNVRKALIAGLATSALVPGAAMAHDGQNSYRYGGYHHHHHFHAVVLKGTVASVDPSSGTLAVKVDKASRGGDPLEGDTVTVKAVKGWVADTNNDGRHSLADVQSGDTVLVFTKRRFIDTDANTVSAGFVLDKTHPKTAGDSAYQGAYRDGAHHCDGR